MKSYLPDERPKNCKQVMTFLKNHGINAELTRGNGYYYFSDPESLKWYSSSIPTYRIGSLTFSEWLKEYESLKNDFRNR